MLNLILVLQNLLIFGMCFALWNLIANYYLMEKLFNLIAVFLLIVFLLLLYGYEFLPLMFLIIYVGSIAILFLFVVMIINPDYFELLNEAKLLRIFWKTTLLREKNKQLSNQLVDFNVNTDLYSNEVNLVKDTYKKLNNNNIIISLYIYLYLYFFSMLSAFGFKVVYELHLVGSVMSSTAPGLQNQGTLINVWTNNSLNLISWRSLNWRFNDIYYISEILYNYYLIEVLFMGFILMMAMFGVIILGMQKNIFIKRQNLSEQFFKYRNF